MATTWAEVGKTPVLRREDKRRGLSCFCALTTAGKQYTIYFTGSIDSDRIVVALRYIRRYQKGPVILIWDKLAAHRGAPVKKYLAEDTLIEIEELPSYSPDLNAEEYCHGYVKERIRNATPANNEQLLQLAEREFRRLRRKPELLQSFFAHAKLLPINLSG